MSDAYELHEGDALAVLRAMESETVDLMVGSPPYWGLRRYAGGWRQYQLWRVPEGENPFRLPGDPDKRRKLLRFWQHRAMFDGGVECPETGARIDALGGEPTVQLYIEHLCEIMEEVRRVLKPSGTAWVVIGDSYAGYWGANYAHKPFGEDRTPDASTPPNKPTPDWAGQGLKPKDLCLVPERLSIALQEQGWWVRNLARWSKENPMPSSDPHKLTPSCETIIFLAKDGREVWADTFDARLPHKSNGRRPGNKSRCYVNRDAQHDEHKRRPSDDRSYHPAGKNPRDAILLDRAAMHRWLDELLDAGAGTVTDLWRIPAANSREEHFATYPELIATLPVQIGCSPRVCAKCGRPFDRVTEARDGTPDEDYQGQALHDYEAGKAQDPSDTKRRVLKSMARQVRTAGWSPRCSCDAGHVPGTVLDPFLGSGTTGVVALREKRRFVGIELAPKYVAMARRRMDALATRDLGRPVHPEVREATTPEEVKAGQMTLTEVLR